MLGYDDDIISAFASWGWKLFYSLCFGILVYTASCILLSAFVLFLLQSRIQTRVNVDAAVRRRNNASSSSSQREGTGQGWATAAVVGVGALLMGLAALR